MYLTLDEHPLWNPASRQARQAANHAARVNRNVVPADDIFQHLMLWVITHWHKLEQWDEEESLPWKLRKTLSNEAQKYVVRERARRSRVQVSDFFFYTPELLHELLRDVWHYTGWTDTPDLSSEFVSRTSKVSEGNDRLAMFSDLTFALGHLNEADRDLLRMRYADGGMDFDAMAAVLGITEEALRKRVQRAIKKLQDRLGGEAPVWRRRRVARSNARAIADTRRQDGQE